jgi:transcription elongation GreA/GreB family factor
MTALVNLRSKIFAACKNQLEEKIASLETALQALTDDAANDSKSTAGDKHEVGRAMMQMEQEKIVKQLHDTIDQKNLVERLAVHAATSQVGNGSFVKTNRGYLLLAAPLGKMVVDGITVMCISSQSPLGQKLIGRNAGETISINGTDYRVEELN